jgi:hypothetical protein
MKCLIAFLLCALVALSTSTVNAQTIQTKPWTMYVQEGSFLHDASTQTQSAPDQIEFEDGIFQGDLSGEITGTLRWRTGTVPPGEDFVDFRVQDAVLSIVGGPLAGGTLTINAGAEGSLVNISPSNTFVSFSSWELRDFSGALVLCSFETCAPATNGNFKKFINAGQSANPDADESDDRVVVGSAAAAEITTVDFISEDRRQTDLIAGWLPDLCVVLFLDSTPPPPPPSGPFFVRGNVNVGVGGGIWYPDIDLLVSHLSQGTPLPCEDAADCNDDGVIDGQDVCWLANFLDGVNTWTARTPEPTSVRSPLTLL